MVLLYFSLVFGGVVGVLVGFFGGVFSVDGDALVDAVDEFVSVGAGGGVLDLFGGGGVEGLGAV